MLRSNAVILCGIYLGIVVESSFQTASYLENRLSSTAAIFTAVHFILVSVFLLK